MLSLVEVVDALEELCGESVWLGFYGGSWKTSLVPKLFSGARLQVKPALTGHSSFRRSGFLSAVEFGWRLFMVFSYVLLGVAFGYVPFTLKLLGVVIFANASLFFLVL
ncbi:hypothetical protein F2Q68_00024843 [Brassica cretica]|uniref:Transmembrane protein n=1 Tax=Brassica cretica TaxID=69181 RepID=A0A8S9IB77_BRACR|nr:hypothetical protein F2Q68_00024843 [Brassica cretica]